MKSWSCRFENILNEAKQVDPAGMNRYNRSDMLRTMLWKGLKLSLKDRSGHTFDALKDYDVLRSALRQVEHEQKHRDEEEAAV